MSNYDIFKSGINSQEKYDDLSAAVYSSHYIPDQLSFYSKNLTLGFGVRFKVFFANALAAIGLISSAARDAALAKAINDIAKTVIQGIGKDTGYYKTGIAFQVKLVDAESSPPAPFPAVDLFRGTLIPAALSSKGEAPRKKSVARSPDERILPSLEELERRHVPSPSRIEGKGVPFPAFPSGDH